MTQQQVYFLLAALVILAIWYQMYSLRNKVIVSYTRRTGQNLVGLKSVKDDHVIIDGRQFYIVPDRVGHRWYKGGFLGMVGLGMYLPYYEYTFGDRWPRDPRNYKLETYDPKVQRVVQNASLLSDYNKGAAKQGGGMKGMGGWGTWILLGCVAGILIMAWYNQQQFTHIAQGQANIYNNLTNMIKALQK